MAHGDNEVKLDDASRRSDVIAPALCLRTAKYRLCLRSARLILGFNSTVCVTAQRQGHAAEGFGCFRPSPWSSNALACNVV